VYWNDQFLRLVDVAVEGGVGESDDLAHGKTLLVGGREGRVRLAGDVAAKIAHDSHTQDRRRPSLRGFSNRRGYMGPAKAVRTVGGRFGRDVSGASHNPMLNGTRSVTHVRPATVAATPTAPSQSPGITTRRRPTAATNNAPFDPHTES
jgi:hypothetical protein